MAAKALSEFTDAGHPKHIFSARRNGLRCSAIRLTNGNLCLYSPVLGLNDAAKESIEQIGSVEFLLAPNHYHNKGLKEYAGAFPKAKLVAHPDAAPRLKKQTGLTFQSIEPLSPLLPRGITLLAPEGLKTGEVWLSCRAQKQVAWLVADAFAGGKETDKDLANTPGFLKTFPNFGVQDKAIYLPWVRRQIKQAKPVCLIPCHGAISRSAKLADELNLLLDDYFT